MAGILDVDIALLRTLGSNLTAVADTVAGLDGSSGLAGVPSGLAGADSARVAAGAGAGERVEAAVKAVGARVRAMRRHPGPAPTRPPMRRLPTR